MNINENENADPKADGLMIEGCSAEDIMELQSIIVELQSEFSDDPHIDVQMPEMDDFEMAGKIREHFGDGRPHIVAVTIHALEEERHRCINAGIDNLSRIMGTAELLSALRLCQCSKQECVEKLNL